MNGGGSGELDRALAWVVSIRVPAAARLQGLKLSWLGLSLRWLRR